MAKFELWKNKEKEILDPKLFSEEAEKLAKKIGEEGKEDRNKNKNSQVRRYFDEVVRLNTLAQQCDSDEEFNGKILPQVHMIIAKVVYAEGRNLVTRRFVSMMKDGINAIHDRKDLQVFTSFLESFMGFYKVYGPK